MCIIVYKPSGKALPDEATLRRCWYMNSDGAGFMYPDEGRVVVSKGYMTLDAFLEALRGVEDPTNKAVVLHFRIGTHGLMDAAHTHPFPVTDEEDVLLALDSVADVAIAHNGIIPCCAKRKDEHSDTFHFVREYASQVIRSPYWYRKPKRVKVLEHIAQSKLAVMSANGHVELIGRFVKDEAGVRYSNESYRVPAWQPRFHSVPDIDWGWEEEIPVPGDRRLFVVDREQKALAAFMPEGTLALNEATGSLFDASADLLLFDVQGRVYCYDNDRDYAMLMDDFTAVDSNLKPIRATARECVSFTVVE